MTPHKGEQLLLYLAATTHVVSTAIVIERQEDGHTYPVQRPVYFVSEVLSESKARYQPVQKLLYAVLITSRKLRHYFQEYSISVVTDCRCLNHSTSMGGTRNKVEGEDRHDLEPEGMREDTRHKIYTGSGSRSSYPTSCLE
jgi:hypothetical protein